MTVKTIKNYQGDNVFTMLLEELVKEDTMITEAAARVMALEMELAARRTHAAGLREALRVLGEEVDDSGPNIE